MDYEKKYNEALELARKIHSGEGVDAAAGWSTLETIFPQLRESEDERIRKKLYHTVMGTPNDSTWFDGTSKEAMLAWLEKQKENPENAISIPSDCVSDAKCEDIWHKTANSLPDDGRDVLAKDALGNYLLASFDGAQWFVSVYDGQDHPVLHTPPILEWCEIPSEKQKEQNKCPEFCSGHCVGCEQKEQKPAEWSEVELEFRGEKVKVKRPFYRDDKGRGYSTAELDEEVAWNALRAWCEKKGISIYDLYPKAEWSEEDEKMLEGIIERGQAQVQWCDTGLRPEQVSWLKSLRPSWKPSKAQLNAMNFAITYFMHETNYKNPTELRELYDELLKLK